MRTSPSNAAAGALLRRLGADLRFADARQAVWTIALGTPSPTLRWSKEHAIGQGCLPPDPALRTGAA